MKFVNAVEEKKASYHGAASAIKKKLRIVTTLMVAVILMISVTGCGLGRRQSKTIIGSLSANYTITMLGVKEAGNYTLRYANAKGVLKDYEPICTLEVTNPAKAVSYKELIPTNCVPVEATVITVHNESNKQVGIIPLDNQDIKLGPKLYSFGLLADIHIGSENGEAGTAKAFDFLTETAEADFICIPGDLTDAATTEQFETLKKLLNAASVPVYVSTGNHDTPTYRGTDDITDDFLMYYTRYPRYYSFTKGDDVFIMFGLQSDTTGKLFGASQLEWLYDTLEENKDKRCFLFQHVFPYDEDCGNAGGFYTLDIWGGEDEAAFYNLMERYSNVIFFHGHSHTVFEGQTVTETANYSDSTGIHSVHIPSVAKPRSPSGDYCTNANQGYVVDVYENNIVLRGINFDTGSYLPIAQYCLDTSIKPIESDPITVPLDLDVTYGIKIDKSTGEETETADYAVSRYIAVEEGITYTTGIYRSNYHSASVICYDENKNFIGCVADLIRGPNEDSVRGVPMEAEIVPIEGTAYIRLRWYAPVNENNPPSNVPNRFWATKTFGE